MIETEAFSLFVVWENNKLNTRTDEGVEISAHNPFVKRATIRKYLHGNEITKRIEIDFDPMQYDQCFVIAPVIKYSEDTHYKISGIIYPHACAIDPEEADKIKKQLEDGDWKKCLSEKTSKPELEYVMMCPTIIRKT